MDEGGDDDDDDDGDAGAGGGGTPLDGEPTPDLDPRQAYANKWLWKYRVDPPPGSDPIPSKLHLSFLDLGAAKQLRTSDILGHFEGWGPAGVEWLGETSVNVVFEDVYSARRAGKATTQEIPPPPAEEGAGAEDGGAEDDDAMDDGGQGVKVEVKAADDPGSSPPPARPPTCPPSATPSARPR